METVKFFHQKIEKRIIRVELTLESFALGDTNDIDHFVLGKDLLDGHLLFEMLTGKVDFISNASTVQLDFHDVSLLLAASQQLLLSVANHTDNLAILLDLIEILLNFFLANIILPFKTSLSKGLLLGLGPSLQNQKLGRKSERIFIELAFERKMNPSSFIRIQIRRGNRKCCSLGE